jgi:hypothetical protein
MFFFATGESGSWEERTLWIDPWQLSQFGLCGSPLLMA